MEIGKRLAEKRMRNTADLTLLEPHSHMWGQNTLTISSLSPKRDWGRDIRFGMASRILSEGKHKIVIPLFSH